MRRLISLLVLTLLVGVSTHAQGQQPSRPPSYPGASTAPSQPASTPPPAQGGRPSTPAPMPGQTLPPPMAQQAPRAETTRAPNIGGPNNLLMTPATNIRLDLVITDTFTGAPVKKSVSMLVLSGNSGMIRTTNTSSGDLAILNVDAIAAAYQNGQISTRITFEYSPARTKEGPLAGQSPPRINESISVVLQDGKSLMISQSADPATDRKVTAELTATILK